MLIKSNIYETTSKMMEEQRGNCAQAIFATYGPLIGLQKIDCNRCMRITAAFGGGINLTGNVCGAITGALMVTRSQIWQEYSKSDSYFESINR